MHQGSLHKPSAASVAFLRETVDRLSNIPVESLPWAAEDIAKGLLDYRHLLASEHSDVSTILQRLNTRILSLLQHRSHFGRWVGVVILKPVIEDGGLIVLSKSDGWVQSLLSILKKNNDPPTTRRFAAIALTTIFERSWDHSSIAQSISARSLPVYIATCLKNLENGDPSPQEVHTILESFVRLLSRHPSGFRASESSIRKLLLRVLSRSMPHAQFTFNYSDDHRSFARQIFVSLHNCAPDQLAAAKWTEALNAVIESAHATCDVVFRSVQEDWQSTCNVKPSVPLKVLFSGEVESKAQDVIGLEKWQGLRNGNERLITLLALLQTYMELPTKQAVSIPIGMLTDLFSRIFSIRKPPANQPEELKSNHEIAKDERVRMYELLPHIHSAAIEAVGAVVIRFGRLMTGILRVLLETVTYVFPTENTYWPIRQATYDFCTTVIKIIGPSMTREYCAELNPIINAACEDILAFVGQGSSGMSVSEGGNMTRSAASRFLETALEKLPAESIVPNIRTLIDRTAILSNHKTLMTRSVLNPTIQGGSSQRNPSILPFLARAYPQSSELEAVLRPRRPPLAVNAGDIKNANVDGQDSTSQQDMHSQLDMDSQKDMASPLDIIGQPDLTSLQDTTEQQDMIELQEVTSQQNTVSSSIAAAGGMVADESEDPEPTSDLLSALTQQTRSPDAAVKESSVDGADESIPAKRAAEDGYVFENSSKRTKPSVGADGDNDSDSDSEMPPLTLDADTDEDGDEM